MSMKKQLRFATVVVALTAIAAPVGAGVITFDDSYANSILYTPFYNGQSFSDGGLTFTSQGQDSVLYVWDSWSPNSNGTNNLIFGFGGGDYLAITKTGGGIQSE